ncbi:Uncharacterized protein COG3236 [hydrothermal vent metagenome]|uniref:Uncharacterized protein COG3236 n=1 Tax=hydrothermal vent metagenome TaxID=652676 RepID=A0A1W1C5G8_9ZZZZ
MKTREELLERIETGETFEYLFFWDEPKRDVVDIACLNQWYAASFSMPIHGQGELHYIIFPTAEHYMMWAKARVFYDYGIADRILETKSPREVQLLGREVKDYDDDKWRALSFETVVEGNIEKFTQNPDIEKFLLSTGDKVLVEASPIDKIWGIGLHKDDPKARDPKKWLGENKLGFALMQVRKNLKEGKYE